MKLRAQIVEPAVLTTAQAAERLCCHPKTVRTLCQQGRIRAIKLGSEWRIPIQALEEFIGCKEEGEQIGS